MDARPVRRCGYCPDVATYTIIAADGKQIDVCVADARRALDGFLTPPRCLSLNDGAEEAVIVDWSWPPFDRYWTDRAFEEQRDADQRKKVS